MKQSPSHQILRELEITPEFMLSEYDLDNIRYGDDIMLMANTGIKLQVFLYKVVKEREKKGLTIVTSYKMSKSMVSNLRSETSKSIKYRNLTVCEVL